MVSKFSSLEIEQLTYCTSRPWGIVGNVDVCKYYRLNAQKLINVRLWCKHVAVVKWTASTHHKQLVSNAATVGFQMQTDTRTQAGIDRYVNLYALYTYVHVCKCTCSYTNIFETHTWRAES